jgi:glutamate---cysteine ligase / carboxylate-amine ligase
MPGRGRHPAAPHRRRRGGRAAPPAALVAEAAEAHGYAAIAASTHPFARGGSRATPARSATTACGRHRPAGLADADLRDACPCRVEDEDLRIDLMNQVAYFLPHLLALSCSSPFWEGDDTRLSSYRLTVFDALPRTGLPDRLASHSEYRRLIDYLGQAGCIEDGTKVWWDVRPSARFPTLEMRITDICPRLATRRRSRRSTSRCSPILHRLRERNQRWRLYPADADRREPLAGAALRLRGHADRSRGAAAGAGGRSRRGADRAGRPRTPRRSAAAELEDLRRIAAEGSSAKRQRAVRAAALAAGADEAEALRAVVDHPGGVPG